MGKFLVQWAIDVEGDDITTPEQAAAYAWHKYFDTEENVPYHENQGIPVERTHNVFTVNDKDTNTESVVDLEELDHNGEIDTIIDQGSEISVGYDEREKLIREGIIYICDSCQCLHIHPEKTWDDVDASLSGQVN